MESSSRMFVVASILASALFLFQYSPWLSAHSNAFDEDVVLVGAGNIATCDSTADSDTAALLDTIAGTVFALGDNAYEDGSYQEYIDCYEPTWGRHKARTMPAVGNHDYHVSGAEGYYTYFGAAASPLDAPCTKGCKGYYSYNLGAWHIIVLNSEVNATKLAEQALWLRADLAAHTNVCTLAYWHRPLFTSSELENDVRVQPFWNALYEYGADVVLNAHEHNYERFSLQNPDGDADPARGIRQFIVGTGGKGHSSFDIVKANSEVRDYLTFGLLKLTLHPTGYDWQFVPITGQIFQDSGSDDCVTFGSSPTNTPTSTATPTEVMAETRTSTSTPTTTPTLVTAAPGASTSTPTATPTQVTAATATATPILTITVTPDLTSEETATAIPIATSPTTEPQGIEQTPTPRPDQLYLPVIIP